MKGFKHPYGWTKARVNGDLLLFLLGRDAKVPKAMLDCLRVILDKIEELERDK